MFDTELANDRAGNWSEMSLDSRLFFAIHLMLIIMLVAGNLIGIPAELAIIGSAYALAVMASLINRRRSGWRWRGAGWKQWLAAAAGILLIAIFLFAVGQLGSPSDPHMVPWFIAGAGIGLFNALRSLRLVRMSQAGFRADCGPVGSAPPAAADHAPKGWKKVLLTVFQIFFLLAWLEAMAFFFVWGASVREGAAQPSAAYSAEIVDHGTVRYVSPERKQLIDQLQLGLFVGIPPAVIGMFLLRAFGIGGPSPFQRRR